MYKEEKGIMYDQSGLLVHEGNPMLPGATKVSGGINFAVEVPADEEASLILYHKGEAELHGHWRAE